MRTQTVLTLFRMGKAFVWLGFSFLLVEYMGSIYFAYHAYGVGVALLTAIPFVGQMGWFVREADVYGFWNPYDQIFILDSILCGIGLGATRLAVKLDKEK